MLGIEQEYQLIANIYDAALDPERWRSVMRDIATACGAAIGVLIARDLLNPDYALLYNHGVTEELLTEYEKGFLAKEVDFVSQRWLKDVPLGEPSINMEFFESEQRYLEVAGDYGHLMKKHGIHYQMLVAFDLGSYRMAGVGLHNAQPFHDSAKSILKRLTPHLRRALEIHRQLSSVRVENAQLHAMLDKLYTGVLLLDGSGRIRYANSHAARLLKNDAALVVKHERLQAKPLAQDEKLQALIRGAIATSQREGLGESGGVLGIHGTQTETPLVLSVTPLSALQNYRDLAGNDIAAAIFISNPDQGIRISVELLRENYQLTPREIDICQRYVNRPSLEDLSQDTGLALSSLRSLFRSIYEKTGQHSQPELLRLLMGLRIDFEHIHSHDIIFSKI